MNESVSYADNYDRRFLLNRNHRSPLWQQIALALEKEIRQGQFAPGDQLPSEGTLAKWYRVNRHTVRRALSELQSRMLIKSERGRGSFVNESVVEYHVSRRTRFSEILNRQNCAPDGILMRHKVMEPAKSVSEALQIPVTSPVAMLDIMRKADGRPLSLTTHYFPLPRFAGIHDTFKKTRSITACFVAHGVEDYFRDETRIVTRPPTTEEARQLGLPRNRPILETRSINVDELGLPVDFGITRYVGDKIQLVIKTF
ncbi:MULTISPECIES: phosphonate metabolism transcriptional regulator PhnF [unclassified Pseudodesulfovibrio]|uniref:phosphonate metabolism transcriptional regulator PhnF n=1 Tax=unclassified Pseudodesulfovibrio TaxID=2661612 RepID=UPI000FEC1111|nr:MULTISPECIES: phosphonate metabolism transcriptional regulator PhnF [unclassified Pseudodesulfovibrio]MCJ2163203.1 phosphonate metabolism transcriptional regulator PhnF [Pseudodesulfovibrio sp. S3-i]RWU07187.1 phosphonate metabolism transcriptional regulator PhnF [Pseudodesulfovibrio sp. S3]